MVRVRKPSIVFSDGAMSHAVSKRSEVASCSEVPYGGQIAVTKRLCGKTSK